MHRIERVVTIALESEAAANTTASAINGKCRYLTGQLDHYTDSKEIQFEHLVEFIHSAIESQMPDPAAEYKRDTEMRLALVYRSLRVSICLPIEHAETDSETDARVSVLLLCLRHRTLE